VYLSADEWNFRVHNSVASSTSSPSGEEVSPNATLIPQSAIRPGRAAAQEPRGEEAVRRARRMAAATASCPSSSLGSHRRTYQPIASAVRFQRPKTTGFSAGGPRHPSSLFAATPPADTASHRQAVRPHLPQPTHTRPARGAASDLPGLFGYALRSRESTPLPWGPGAHAAQRRHPRATADNPRALDLLQATETGT
jgi:hypothetical protein